MRTKKLLVLIFMAALILSCESNIDDMIPANEITLEDVTTRSTSIDSLELGNLVPIEETEEFKAFKELLDKQMRAKMSPMAYGDYDEHFSSNIYAIRELAFTLYARGQGNTNNRYLSCTGANQEVKLTNKAGSNERFYVKVLPATSGIPYLIYSVMSKTPLVVGYYNSNPDNKILFAKPDDTGSLFSASWDLIPSQNYPGYFAIESQSYLGQSDPNNMWSVFNHVLEVKNDNKIGYAKYSNSAKQEFLLKSIGNFTLRDMTFDANSAVISPASDIKIVSTTRNPSVEPKPYTIPVNKIYYENSYFSEKKGYIDFSILNLTKTFKRPTVQANRIVLPETSTPTDATYRTTGTQSIRKDMIFNIEGDAPENCLIEVTSTIKTYNVSIPYTVTADFSDRVIKFSGTWRGYIISDPKLAKPNHVPRFFDLDTGEEIYYFLRSAIKTTFNK